MERRDEFISILEQSAFLMELFEKIPSLALPNWYVAAGAITQTIWNARHGFESTYGIKDADVIYFDPDTSPEAEDVFIKKGEVLLEHLPVPIEIRNEARVHLWYPEYASGRTIEPYTSVESAIDTFPTTATSIGVRKNTNGEWDIYAPFGLDDLLDMVVRPNKRQITQDIYESKAGRWKEVWSNLVIHPWE